MINDDNIYQQASERGTGNRKLATAANNYQIITELDDSLKKMVAEWYNEEWQIPLVNTLALLDKITGDAAQVHVVLMVDDRPVATAGLHNSVGIMAYYPELSELKNWLALVYTVPSERKKGYATLLCEYLEAVARQKRLPSLHLFTHTAEDLYRSLQWTTTRHLHHGTKKIALMQKRLDQASSS